MNHLATGGLWLWRWPRSWALTQEAVSVASQTMFTLFSFFLLLWNSVRPAMHQSFYQSTNGCPSCCFTSCSVDFRQCLLILLSIPVFQDSRSWEIFLESASLDANSLASWIDEKSVWQPFFPPSTRCALRMAHEFIQQLESRCVGALTGVYIFPQGYAESGGVDTCFSTLRCITRLKGHIIISEQMALYCFFIWLQMNLNCYHESRFSLIAVSI